MEGYFKFKHSPIYYLQYYTCKYHFSKWSHHNLQNKSFFIFKYKTLYKFYINQIKITFYFLQCMSWHLLFDLVISHRILIHSKYLIIHHKPINHLIIYVYQVLHQKCIFYYYMKLNCVRVYMMGLLMFQVLLVCAMCNFLYKIIILI
jgi:hypothetical protein